MELLSESLLLQLNLKSCVKTLCLIILTTENMVAALDGLAQNHLDSEIVLKTKMVAKPCL